MLVDVVEITVKSGNGGDGMVAWRREKHVPRGGPDGGDGGKGGNVVLIADNNVDTLSSFRYRKVFQAQNGSKGKNKKMTGAGGEDLILTIPVGTVVTDIDIDVEVIDFSKVGQKFTLARGGIGGQGNPHFSTSTHQTPEEFTPGKPGMTRNIRLELRMIADVALIGQPNAGKSTIINDLTEANSRVGAYAFSTREPVLGVMNSGEGKISLVDMPGLIEGAHKGKGLGDEFLKHTKRVKSIIHVVDSTTTEIEKSIEIIKNELEQYDSKLSSLPYLLVVNKIDLLSDDELSSLKKQFPKAIFISAENKLNIEELRSEIVEITS